MVDSILFVNLIPFPKTAKSGIIRKKITIIPPIKVPTNISGLPSEIAASDRLISGIEVRRPNRKKETAKEDTFNLCDNLSIEFIINPDPIHMKIYAIAIISKLIIISINPA